MKLTVFQIGSTLFSVIHGRLVRENICFYWERVSGGPVKVCAVNPKSVESHAVIRYYSHSENSNQVLHLTIYQHHGRCRRSCCPVPLRSAMKTL